MNFEQLAEERHSVRKFSSRAVEPEKLDLILRAGRIAPTACNNQPQRILVIQDKAGMEKLARCTTYTFGASMALLVCCDQTASWVRPYDSNNSFEVDASIVTSHMMLQAADLGLGTTWVGHFDPAKARSEFNIPANLVPVAILPLGYPAEDSKKNRLHFTKLSPEAVVFYNDFSAS